MELLIITHMVPYILNLEWASQPPPHITALTQRVTPVVPHHLTMSRKLGCGEEIVIWRKLNSFLLWVEFTKC